MVILRSSVSPYLIRRCGRRKVGILIFVLNVFIHSPFLFTLIPYVIVPASILLLLLLLFLSLWLWLVFGIPCFLFLASLVLKLAAVFHLRSHRAALHLQTPIRGLLLATLTDASSKIHPRQSRQEGVCAITCIGASFSYFSSALDCWGLSSSWPHSCSSTTSPSSPTSPISCAHNIQSFSKHTSTSKSCVQHSRLEQSQESPSCPTPPISCSDNISPFSKAAMGRCTEQYSSYNGFTQAHQSHVCSTADLSSHRNSATHFAVACCTLHVSLS